MPTLSQLSGEGSPQLLFQASMGIALIIILQALLDGVELCCNYRAVHGVQLMLETCLDLASPS